MNPSAHLLKNKSVIVCGGTPNERQAFITEAKQLFFSGQEKNVYELREGIKSSEQYIRSIEKEFPITSPLGISKNEMNYDQLKDVQLDWVRKKKNVLVIIPELDKLVRADLSFFHEMLGGYLAEQQVRLLVTLANPITLDYRQIPQLLDGAAEPSEKNLEVVDINGG